MPSAAGMSHQYLTSDVRYIDDHKLGGRAHAISIMDNHSRCILASASPCFKTSPPTSRCCAQRWRSTTPRRPSSPDGRRIFRAKQARAVYETLDIAKHEIVRGRSWQGYIEATRQRRRAEASGARPGPSGRRCREKCRKDLYATSACWFRSTRLSTILDTPIHKTSIL
jgi:hypothetical protein